MSFNNVKHIACLFDFNEESRLVLSISGSLAVRSSAELYAIHVMEHFINVSGLMLGGVPTYHNYYIDDGGDEAYQKTLRRMIEESVPKNIPMVLRILYNPQVQTVLEVLRECQANLCVIDLKNKRTWGSYLFSPSMIQQIIRSAPCPVMTINPYSLHGEHYVRPN